MAAVFEHVELSGGSHSDSSNHEPLGMARSWRRLQTAHDFEESLAVLLQERLQMCTTTAVGHLGDPLESDDCVSVEQYFRVGLVGHGKSSREMGLLSLLLYIGGRVKV